MYSKKKDITLDTIDLYAIRGLFSSNVWKSGVSAYQRGVVNGMDRVGSSLIARVIDGNQRPYLVTLTEKGGGLEGFDCTCRGSRACQDRCVHIAAALLKWLDVRSALRKGEVIIDLSPSPGPFFSGRNLDRQKEKKIPSGLAHKLTKNKKDKLFSGWFIAKGALRVEIDIPDRKRDVEVVIKSKGEKGKLTRWNIPIEKAKKVIESLKAKHTVNITDRARKFLSPCPLIIPGLEADYDQDGNLVLTPSFADREGKRVFSAKEVMEGRKGGYFWTDSGCHPVEPVPKALRPYFDKGGPVVIKDKAIAYFLRYELKELQKTHCFYPSTALEKSRILFPSLKRMKVEREDRDWFWLDPRYIVDDHELTLSEVLSADKNEGFLRKGNDWFEVSDELIRLEGSKVRNGRIKLHKTEYLRSKAEWDGAFTVEPDQETRRFEVEIERIEPPAPGPEPEDYKGCLRPYQKDGYNWLWFLHKNGFNGILADEMGLGKTHQAMALLSAVYNNGTELPSLIVCPTSVLDHWEDKLTEYAPALKVSRYHGLKREGLLLDMHPATILTTYTILSRDIERLREIEWKYIILDEAQKIKNFKTKMFRASKQLKAHHRLALTGTPVENRLSELWSIFDFLNPGYLWSHKEFRERFETPIMKYSDRSAEATLKRIIHPFKLRRLKTDVLKDLPPKVEDTRLCELAPHQIALYRSIVDKEGMNLIEHLKDSRTKVEYIHIFSVLSKLKRICDHPSLVLTGRKKGSLTSGKFESFKELLDEAIESGEKVVVFSQYLEMMDIIEAWLKRKRIGYSSLRGSTRNRRRVIERFQEDPECRVFVGSLMAGGLGIDLTSASVVIHYDRWWNAARENQATDRVHRIGQKKGVNVFKLITRGTLEEKIDNIIKRKAELMDTIVENDPSGLKALTREELIELLTFNPTLSQYKGKIGVNKRG